MESGHKSGGGSAAAGAGAGGGDGVLCHACGYQYPNGHPSAKQRRAHRKHCAKPASSPAAGGGGEEHDGSEPLPGEGHGGVGPGGEIGASAAECGGGSPGSVPEGTTAVEGGDSAEHYPGNGTEHQVTGDKCAEDSLNSSSTDGATLTTVATQYLEKGSPIEDTDPSEAAVGSEQLEAVPTSVLSPEPEDGAKSSSGISGHEIQSSLPEYETQNSAVVPLESNATGGETSEKVDDVVSQVDGGIVVTEGDGLINTTSNNKFSEEKSVEGDEVDLSCQDNLQTEIGEGLISTAMEEDSSDKNPNAIHTEEIPSDEAETHKQIKHVLTDSFEKIPNIEVPVESSTEKSGVTDDVLPGLGTGSSQLETPDDVKPQLEPDSTSETSGHLEVSKGADNVDGQQYPISEGSISAISSAFGPAVGGTANITENVCSSGSTMDDNMHKNVIGGTVVTSQVDLAELSTSTTALEIDMVDSTNDADEKRQNEKGGTDVTSYGGNEMYIIENIEEKQQNKEVMVDSIPYEANTVSSADIHGGNEQNKEFTADASSCKISVVQSMTSAEEKEQIEEFIANLAPEETTITSSSNIVEEKQGEIDVKTNGDIDGAHVIETAAENNAATCEINAGTTTDDTEDVVQNEKLTTGPISHGINMVCSSVDEAKMHKEELTEGLGSHENIVVHGTDNVEEKTIEETKADATSPKFSFVTSTFHGRSAVHSADNNDEKKNEDPILDQATTSATICSRGAVEEKESEETAEDPSSGESNKLPGTNDEENKQQLGETAPKAPASEEVTQTQTTTVVEAGNPEDTASKEISTIESTDDLKAIADQNEEIADKEMVIDSDKNHVSLKVLLADKNVETKEKEKKTTTKDRVLSFRRRASKDSVSPVKPGSPKAGSGQQDWNSPARLPVEKKPKGRKQQWVPFICCSSVQ
nr:unnamed protein product [Digitaria exilis]